MGILKEKYGKKKVMLTSSDSTGCGGYRTWYPYEFIKDNFEWIQHSFGFPVKNPIINEPDVMFIQRATHEFFPKWIEFMRSQGKKVVYDIDDDLWHIPSSNLAGRHYPPKELRKVDAVIKACDAITCSTIPLKHWLEKHTGKPTFVIPNHVWHKELEVKPKNEKIKIGWAGSYTHNGDFDYHLVKFLRELPKDKVEFSCVGFMPQFMNDFAKLVPWIDFKEYHNEFVKLNWDIGIIVAEENNFNTCKSNIKYLEYSQAKCVSVAHNVYPYATTIEHGVDGFLVSNTKTDWKQYINQLIENDTMRLDMANKAFDKVKHNYTYDYDAEALEAQYVALFDYLFEGKQ